MHYNDRFHLEIGKIARNAYLMPSLRRLLLDHARLGKIFYRAGSPADMQRDLSTAVDQHDLSRRCMAEYAMPAGIEVSISG